MSFQVGLWSFFVSIKSLLDVFAQLISRLIDPTAKTGGFHKKNINGELMVGGDFINWMNNRVSPECYPNRDLLIDIIKKNIKTWISYAVKKRDGIVHYGNLSGISYIV